MLVVLVEALLLFLFFLLRCCFVLMLQFVSVASVVFLFFLLLWFLCFALGGLFVCCCACGSCVCSCCRSSWFRCVTLPFSFLYCLRLIGCCGRPLLIVVVVACTVAVAVGDAGVAPRGFGVVGVVFF